LTLSGRVVIDFRQDFQSGAVPYIRDRAKLLVQTNDCIAVLAQQSDQAGFSGQVKRTNRNKGTTLAHLTQQFRRPSKMAVIQQRCHDLAVQRPRIQVREMCLGQPDPELVQRRRLALGIKIGDGPKDAFLLIAAAGRGQQGPQQAVGIDAVERAQRNVSLENIFRLAKALGATPEELLTPIPKDER